MTVFSLRCVYGIASGFQRFYMSEFMEYLRGSLTDPENITHVARLLSRNSDPDLRLHIQNF